MCRTWHHSVPTMGLMCVDQRQPGCWMSWETVMPPIVSISERTVSISIRSSGLEKLRTWCRARSSIGAQSLAAR